MIKRRNVKKLSVFNIGVTSIMDSSSPFSANWGYFDYSSVAGHYPVAKTNFCSCRGWRFYCVCSQSYDRKEMCLIDYEKRSSTLTCPPDDSYRARIHAR